MRRRQRPTLTLAVAGVLLLVGCCGPGLQAGAEPVPPDPAEEVLAALTQALKLDAAQQQKTRELWKQLADRDDAIRAGWATGKKVDPMALLESRGQFERDFTAILTPEQQRLFRENRVRFILETRRGRRS